MSKDIFSGNYRLEKILQRQSLPKKLIINKKIILKSQAVSHTKEYDNFFSLQVTIWIPDTPYSKIPPRICMTINIANKWVRIVVDRTEELETLLNEIKDFITKNKDIIDRGLEEATKEWEILHQLMMKTPLEGEKSAKVPKAGMREKAGNKQEKA